LVAVVVAQLVAVVEPLAQMVYSAKLGSSLN
jgi:hypothetical protein